MLRFFRSSESDSEGALNQLLKRERIRECVRRHEEELWVSIDKLIKEGKKVTIIWKTLENDPYVAP